MTNKLRATILYEWFKEVPDVKLTLYTTKHGYLLAVNEYLFERCNRTDYNSFMLCCEELYRRYLRREHEL